MSNNKLIPFRVDEETYNKINTYCKTYNNHRSEFIRRIVTEVINAYENLNIIPDETKHNTT